MFSIPSQLSPSERLLLAVRERRIGLVRTLLQAGGNVHYQGSEGLTPLMEATLNLDQAMIRLLLENGANVHAVDARGLTAFNHLYAEYDEEDEEPLLGVIDILLAAGADPEHGYGSLNDNLASWAATNGHQQILARVLPYCRHLSRIGQEARTFGNAHLQQTINDTQGFLTDDENDDDSDNEGSHRFQR